jgi:hypothetical protein
MHEHCALSIERNQAGGGGSERLACGNEGDDREVVTPASVLSSNWVSCGRRRHLKNRGANFVDRPKILAEPCRARRFSPSQFTRTRARPSSMAGPSALRDITDAAGQSLLLTHSTSDSLLLATRTHARKHHVSIMHDR